MTEYTIHWPVVVSAGSTLIALGALLFTSAKYRIDLFDRRFAIYAATLDVYQALYVSKDVDLSEVGKPFVKGCRQSQYLFDDRSGIYEALELFRTEYSKVKAFRDEDAKPLAARDRARWNTLHRNQLESSIKLEAALKDLEGRLMPYLTYRLVGDLKFWRYWGKPRAKFDR